MCRHYNDSVDTGVIHCAAMSGHARLQPVSMSFQVRILAANCANFANGIAEGAGRIDQYTSRNSRLTTFDRERRLFAATVCPCTRTEEQSRCLSNSCDNLRIIGTIYTIAPNATTLVLPSARGLGPMGVNMNRMIAFLSGAACGAAVGVVAALLLTPSSGDEIQTTVRDWFESLWDDAQQAVEDRRSALETQLAELKQA